MQPPTPHKQSPESMRILRLPDDILYLVTQFSTFETRATLVRCNRWLHQNCTSLLFKDINIYSRTQLMELVTNEEAMRMLSKTDSVNIDENIFAFDSWPDQSIEDAPDLIVSLLSATSSLSWIQICKFAEEFPPEDPPLSLAIENTHKKFGFYSKIGQKLDTAVSNPAFLPNLAILIEYPESFSLRTLCARRPVIYHYYAGELNMHVDIWPSFEKFESGSSLKHNLSAYDIGVLIRESGYSSPYRPGGCGIQLSMRFPEEIKHAAPGPIQDTFAWTKTMLAASKIDFDEIYRLDVSFEPNPPYLSIAAQFVLVEELYEEFPELEEISIWNPGFLWSRSVDNEIYESKYFPEDPLPEWTPSTYTCDPSHWMNWWLNALGLSQDPRGPEEVAQITMKLMDGIRLRWDDNCTPTLESVLSYLTYKLHSN